MIRKKSKTETIKDRLVYVYLPSDAMVKQWKEASGKADMTLSKFVIEHVNNSLQQEQNKEGYAPRAKLLEELKKIQDENKELYKKIKMYESLVMRLDEENKGYRTKPFLEEEYSGYRDYEADLVNLFRTRLEVRKEELYKELGVNPQDAEKVKGIRKQIEILKRYGMLKDIGGKWRWKG